jgi:hypothetical protein
MFRPNAEGFVAPTGPQVGGHAYLMNGVNLTRGIARFINSWGLHYGLRGYFYMDLTHVEQLLLNRGEACTAVEVAS